MHTGGSFHGTSARACRDPGRKESGQSGEHARAGVRSIPSWPGVRPGHPHTVAGATKSVARRSGGRWPGLTPGHDGRGACPARTSSFTRLPCTRNTARRAADRATGGGESPSVALPPLAMTAETRYTRAPRTGTGAMPAFAHILLGYLLGAIPFGLLLTRAAGLRRHPRHRLRQHRRHQRAAHRAKGAGRRDVAAGRAERRRRRAARRLASPGRTPRLWAGLGAVLGHLFPVWLGFKGGKGVATGYGVLIAAAWPVGLAAGAVWLIVAARTAPVVAGRARRLRRRAVPGRGFRQPRPSLSWRWRSPCWCIVRHHANIRRLLAGTEPRIGRHGGGKA